MRRLRAFPVGATHSLARDGIERGGAIAIAIDVLPNATRVDLDAFAVAYSLTAAQKRLLAAMMRAGALREAAAALGISPHTAKNHLASIFEKTGCQSQAQLMLLLGAFR